MRTNTKRNVIFILAFIIFVSSIISPVFMGYASYEEAVQNFNKESSEFLEDAEEAKDIIKILEEDSKENPNPPRDSISYVMKRLFYPGVYVNDVTDGVIASELKKEKDDILYNGTHACNPNTPVNLINHNCNIPNFTTGLIQNIVDPFTPPMNNAEKTSSYSDFGLGVPDDIPGGIVPINPESRTNTYTALELFGYNLKLTSYNGEWDNVVVSSSARMLSNFGVIDRITLVGTSLWNSSASGIASFVENFSFNPVRWFSSIGKSFEAAASAGVNTVVDTSELNVVATNAWKRPRLDNTLYNVYVMTDAEVLRETYINYFTIFSDELDLKTNDSAKLQEVVRLNPASLGSVTPFNYDPQWETDESKAIRTAAQAQRDSDIAHNQAEDLKAEYSDEPYSPNYVPVTTVPEPVYYTESEQLGFWAENPDVAGLVGPAESNGLIEGPPSSYSTYEEMVADWETTYTPFFNMNFDALGVTMTELIEETDSSVFLKYPHLDPKQGISKYACSNPDGTMKRKGDGTAEYLYLNNNTKTQEFLNPNCAEARPPIGGGLMGNGWDNPKVTDTRHVSNIVDDNLGIFHKTSNTITSAIMNANTFIAKVTNVIINLSFAPLMEELGITTIVEKIIVGFRDTVFFPLATIFASVGALVLFFEVIKTGSILRIFGSLAVTIIIFVAGTTFLLHPGATMKIIDEIPSKFDSFLAEAILVDDDGSDYCSTGSSGDGIRSAQCNVWGAMVFEPWVYLQFGTAYNNLYAKGHTPSNGGSFDNQNESLVGDAAVNMGGGKIENNWALYQLSVTKSGTINAKDTSDKVGVVDKSIYKLVDLQAGPDNGAKSDGKYFKNWSGQDKSDGFVILTLIQSIALAIAIGTIGFAKIEVTFMFAISMILLPFMLLAGLIPQGQVKLREYVLNLLSLLLRKIILVVLMSILLKIITLVYANSSSITTASILSIFVSVAIIIYRKELVDLLTFNGGSGTFGTDPSKFRESIKETIPTGIKQFYEVAKSNVKGSVAGFAGGAVGSVGQATKIRLERSSIARELKDVEDKIAKGEDDEKLLERRDELKGQKEEIDYAIEKKKSMSAKQVSDIKKKSNELYLQIAENELEIKRLITDGKPGNEERIASLSKENEELEEKREELAIMAAGGERTSKGVLAQALRGSVHSRSVIGRSTERKLRTQGYAGATSYRDIRSAVLAEGAKNIIEQKESIEHDVYKDVLANSKDNINRNPSEDLNHKEKGQLEDPKVQRYVRKLAEERRKIAEEKNKPALTPDIKKLEKAAKVVDRKRKLETVKGIVVSPIASYETHKEDMKAKASNEETTSKVVDMIDEFEEHANKGGKRKINIKGQTIIEDLDLKHKNKPVIPKDEDFDKMEEKLKGISEEMDEIEEDYRLKMKRERENLEKELFKEKEQDNKEDK